MSGPDVYQLYLLCSISTVANRPSWSTPGGTRPDARGVAVAMTPDVAEITSITRPPSGRKDVSTQLFRLLEAHEVIIEESR